jgi:RHS repeat-associated protein
MATQTETYSYDANGNMVNKSEGSKRWRYTWDFENRMSAAWDRKQRVRYHYDALGRRVHRVLGYGKENTKFTYDGLDVIMDDDANTGITRYQNGLGIDNKLKLTNAGNAKYFLQDHLGSTAGLSDSNGNVVSSASYDSFGNPSNTNLSSQYQYTGREFDNFTGLQYSRARFYDPKIGRFISEDPIGFIGGDVNLYGYVRNRPIVLRDPSGHFPIMLPLMTLTNRKLACEIDGNNPWFTGEFGGGVQFGPLGGSAAIVIAANPLTGEVAGFTKLMSGNGGSTGVLATADAQFGVTLGSSSGSQLGGTSGEVFLDASAFDGASGSFSFVNGLGLGVSVGPTIGGGAAGGLRIGEATPLFSLNKNTCACKSR